MTRAFMVFIGVFVLGSVLLNVAIRVFTPVPYMGLLSDKLLAYESHAGKIDLVFVGSSRTFRQVNAPLIERKLRQDGCGDYKVFNLGIPNLTYPELRYVLDHIYAAKSDRLKMVVFGIPLPAVRSQVERIKMDRNRYFSDFSGTAKRLQHITEYQESGYKRLMRAGISLLAMGYEYSNLGHLARLIFPEAYAKNGLQDLESMNMPADWMELRGYYPLEVAGNVTDVVQENHERFLKGDAAFEGLINNQKTEGVGLAELPHKNLLSLYSNMFADIEGHGLKAGFYVPPLPGRTAENMALVDALKGNNSEVLFFDYNDPDRYGQYWDKAVWYDDAHLNDNASAMLSEDMASQICKVSKAWGAR